MGICKPSKSKYTVRYSKHVEPYNVEVVSLDNQYNKLTDSYFEIREMKKNEVLSGKLSPIQHDNIMSSLTTIIKKCAPSYEIWMANPIFPHYMRDSGVRIICRTLHELLQLNERKIINMSRVSFGPDTAIVGGVRSVKRTKAKPKSRKRKVRKLRTMDCSPGNVYESSALMVTDASGALNIVIALNNPQQIFNGVTATGAQDLANNWDAYSVERVSMSTQIRAPITARQGEWNLICDHDSSPPTTAITQNLLLTYTDKRSYSSQAAPRWSVVPRKLSQCEYISAPAADPEPAVIVSKGKYDWNTPPANGFMYVKLVGGPASTNIGTIYVRVHVTAWYKRRLAVAVPSPSFVCPMLQEEDSSEESEKVKKPVKKKKDC